MTASREHRRCVDSAKVGLDQRQRSHVRSDPLQSPALVALGRRMVELEVVDRGRAEAQRPIVVARAEDHHLRDGVGDRGKHLCVEERGPCIEVRAQRAAARRPHPLAEAELRIGLTVRRVRSHELRAVGRDRLTRPRGNRPLSAPARLPELHLSDHTRR